ncbi:MAG: hypothetical protein LAT82_03440 [Nanoarchaeota archaeon]|nr:hypothetical protein [Nanoarchaeota archaeon]
MVEHVFNTHSFLFTLQDDKVNTSGYIIEYYSSPQEKEEIIIKDIEITISRLSFKVVTLDNKKITLQYMRVLRIFNANKELIWDDSEKDLSNIKIINGYN